MKLIYQIIGLLFCISIVYQGSVFSVPVKVIMSPDGEELLGSKVWFKETSTTTWLEYEEGNQEPQHNHRYDFKILPGATGNYQGNLIVGGFPDYILRGYATKTVSRNLSEIEILWPAVSIPVYLINQNKEVICGSKYIMGYIGIWANFSCHDLPQTTITLPVTKVPKRIEGHKVDIDSVRGSWADEGFEFTISPAINGTGMHYYELKRLERRHIEHNTEKLEFEWKMAKKSFVIVDQNGEDIGGAQFIAQGHYGGYGFKPSGEDVELPVTDPAVYPNLETDWNVGNCLHWDYLRGLPVWVIPGIEGRECHYYKIVRWEPVQITDMPNEIIPLEYPMAEVTVKIVDQYGLDIRGSTYYIHACYSWGPERTTGTSVYLPVNDPDLVWYVPRIDAVDCIPAPEYFREGQPISVFPTIKGHDLEGKLKAKFGIRVPPDREPKKIIWPCATGCIYVVDSQGNEIQGSQIEFYDLSNTGVFRINNGAFVQIPTTKESHLPPINDATSLGDWVKNDGIPIRIWVDEVTSGDGVFSFDVNRDVTPHFITIMVSGQPKSYGIRIKSCPKSNRKYYAFCPKVRICGWDNGFPKICTDWARCMYLPEIRKWAEEIIKKRFGDLPPIVPGCEIIDCGPHPPIEPYWIDWLIRVESDILDGIIIRFDNLGIEDIKQLEIIGNGRWLDRNTLWVGLGNTKLTGLNALQNQRPIVAFPGLYIGSDFSQRMGEHISTITSFPSNTLPRTEVLQLHVDQLIKGEVVNEYRFDSNLDVEALTKSEFELKAHRKVTEWLHCELCDPKEFAEDVSFGDIYVPTLRTALLKGPSLSTLESVRHQLTRKYRTKDDISLNQYVKTDLKEYIFKYHIRAATALAALGSLNAKMVLKEALKSPLSEEIKTTIRELMKEKKM